MFWFVETPRIFIIEKLSIRKPRSLSVYEDYYSISTDENNK
jgi:hypothetical protein